MVATETPAIEAHGLDIDGFAGPAVRGPIPGDRAVPQGVAQNLAFLGGSIEASSRHGCRGRRG
jgi:hypothetical protein